MDDFEELLGEVLAEAAGVEGRPGMEGRLLARLASDIKEGWDWRMWVAGLVMAGAAVWVWVGSRVELPQGGGGEVRLTEPVRTQEVTAAPVQRVRAGRRAARGRARDDVESVRVVVGAVTVTPLEVAPLAVTPLVVAGSRVDRIDGKREGEL